MKKYYVYQNRYTNQYKCRYAPVPDPQNWNLLTSGAKGHCFDAMVDFFRRTQIPEAAEFADELLFVTHYGQMPPRVIRRLRYFNYGLDAGFLIRSPAMGQCQTAFASFVGRAFIAAHAA